MGEASGRETQSRLLGTALVALGPSANSAAGRPLTDFLTQLIACDHRQPAYRRARKAEPANAASAYSEHPGSTSVRLDRSV